MNKGKNPQFVHLVKYGNVSCSAVDLSRWEQEPKISITTLQEDEIIGIVIQYTVNDYSKWNRTCN